MYEKANQFIVLDINTTKVTIDNHMDMIQVQIGRNMIDDVFVDGGIAVNIIIEKLRAKLWLFKLKLAPYNLWMANQTETKPVGSIKDLRMYVHGIPYTITFTIYWTLL